MSPYAGICKDLSEISQREYICAKPHLVISEEDHVDDGISRTSSTSQTPVEPRAATPPATACGHDMETQDMEIERLRSVAATPPPTIPALDVETEVINIEGGHSSPVRQDEVTPASAQKLRSVSVSPLRTNDVVGTIQTPDLAASLGDHGSQMETPMTFLDSGTFQEKFGLSDTTHLINSAEEVSCYILSYLLFQEFVNHEIFYLMKDITFSFKVIVHIVKISTQFCLPYCFSLRNV